MCRAARLTRLQALYVCWRAPQWTCALLRARGVFFACARRERNECLCVSKTCKVALRENECGAKPVRAIAFNVVL